VIQTRIDSFWIFLGLLIPLIKCVLLSLFPFRSIAYYFGQEEVSRQIATLFKDAPDLRADFKIFMPDRGQQFMKDVPTPSRSKEKDRRKMDAVSLASSLPLKRKRKATEKEKEREKEQALMRNLPPSKANKTQLLNFLPVDKC